MKSNRKPTWFLIALAIAMVMTAAGCAVPSTAPATNNTTEKPAESTAASQTPQADPFLTGEKPILNVLTRYKAYNMEEQPSYKIVEEITGYKIKWFMQPQDNATEKILLEIASGTSYDFCSQVGGGTNELNAQNALLDLKPYLDKYGPNIYAAIPDDMARKAVTDKDGRIFCIRNAVVDEPASGEDSYGCLKGGIGFNISYLDALGKKLPTNLVDLYDTLKAYTEKNGKPALTQIGAWNVYILAGFGMGNPSWYDVNGQYTHRIKHPGTVEYLAFMQKLYKEGLLDNDFPVNTAESAKEKFTNGTVMAYPVNFWDLDSIYKAFEAAGINTKVQAATFLAKDASTAPEHYISQGVGNVSFIPKTAKNPEHAIIWFNMLSDPANYKRIYIGEEGVSYEVKDGKYYPIFPAFNDYLNADMFVGVQSPGELFKMWQARARKTEAMAEIHQQMNARISEYKIHYYYDSYTSSMEAVQKNESALNTMVNDSLIQAIVSGEAPQTAINNIIAKWDKEGGADYEKAMQGWYAENKASFK